ncbi:MAG TPA: YceI family protein [Chryseosolibacter sp.]|nr:YceI family protein [Chryseosolibacter sp.]
MQKLTKLVGSIFAVVVFLSPYLDAYAQTRYTLKTGEISFTSNAELELIKASSAQVQGLIDPQTNQFAFSIDVQTFRGFNSELQREHFNEKYMESERFPKARFSGKIIEQIDFTANDTYEVRAKGELEIHGEKQTRIIKGRITTRDGVVKVDAKFLVPLADHNITIPSIVSQKIATEIEVVFTASMVLQ